MQQLLHPQFPFESKIKSRSNKMLVLFARSVSVADAIIPINITNKISFEKFIPLPLFVNFRVKPLKTSKISFGGFSFAI